MSKEHRLCKACIGRLSPAKTVWNKVGQGATYETGLRHAPDDTQLIPMLCGPTRSDALRWNELGVIGAM